MTILPWILFAAAVVWFFASQRLNHRKRNQLENYTVLLLLDDELRTHHQKALHDWLRDREASNALELSLASHRVIDNMAEQLAVGDKTDPATSSAMGAHAALWVVKQRLAGNTNSPESTNC
ncbi:MAG: hypothetical protein V4444_03285 [Pseudomonadota bacterium]